MTRVKFGLIGYGSFGSMHAHAMGSAEGAELAAVCTGSEQSAAKAGAELGVPAYYDYREMLRRADVDAVSIVLPNFLHEEVAVAALEAGKHILLEKPMAVSAQGCAAILAAARRAGRTVAMNHECRHSPLWGSIRQQIAGGAIGAPRYAMINLWRFPYRQGSGGWRYDLDRVGNWIFEEPIHFFDLLRWYIGQDPVRVSARGNSRKPAPADMSENFAAVVDFPGGAYGVLTQTLTGYGHELRGEVVGTGGALRFAWIGVSDRAERPEVRLEHWDGQELHSIPVPPEPGESYELALQYRAMVAAIREGAAPAATGEDGAWAVLMCQTATESMRRMEPVDLVPGW